MALWDKSGIPHKGWTCIFMEDLGADLEDLDADERKDYYENCEMCNHEGIRYVHIMEHPEFDGQLRVGCSCAEKMEEDYANPRLREKALRNKYSRLATFMKKKWTLRPNGNYTLKFKGYYITIMSSKFKKDEYGIIFNGKQTWKINSLSKAKRVAFDIIDAHLQN
ncbi:hypothetical protein [Sporomusa sp. GT1]|uniref:hypothetical protein n=1 Tax=Sporomusa sp. GT1 TaxID=1534747 RepID=UPI0016686552|nr:hypothetical protein [Sporomusa sp. GT1]